MPHTPWLTLFLNMPLICSFLTASNRALSWELGGSSHSAHSIPNYCPIVQVLPASYEAYVHYQFLRPAGVTSILYLRIQALSDQLNTPYQLGQICATKHFSLKPNSYFSFLSPQSYSPGVCTLWCLPQQPCKAPGGTLGRK